MRHDYDPVDGGHRKRDPDLPDRSHNRESFHQSIPYPTGTEEDFDRHYVELYGDEEHLVNGRRTGSAHFPGRTERARMHAEYTFNNRYRRITREAYNDEYGPASAEYRRLDSGQREYYGETSGGMLPRHHAALLPLARDREEPNWHNAISRQRLLEGGYEYHTLEDQQTHWNNADEAYMEHGQARADYASHRRYRSDPNDPDTVDCYNDSPVHDTRPHTGSRRQGVPPPGYYCNRLSAPPEEDERWAHRENGRR